MLDVSDVLADPDLEITFTLIRATVTIDGSGRASRQAEKTTLSGVILPATDQQLDRLPEGDRSSEVVAVYCVRQLTSGTETLAPDEITWRGMTYRIKQILDMVTVGGFCTALAISIGMHGREVDA